MHPVFVIETVELSFLFTRIHTPQHKHNSAALSPLLPDAIQGNYLPKQRTGGKPTGTFLLTSPTGS
jgi:hypothetical protein